MLNKTLHPVSTITDLQAGDFVSVATDWGIGETVNGLVTSIELDIKPGMHGIGYELINGARLWAYLTQVKGAWK